MAIQLIMLVAGCFIGVLGSFSVSRYFHAKSERFQREACEDLSDIRSVVASLRRNVVANTFETVAKPLLQSVHGYVSSMACLGQEIRRLKKTGSNRKVQMLVGEIEMFNESLLESLETGEN